MTRRAALTSAIAVASGDPAGELIPVGAYARLSEDKAMRSDAAAWREVGDQVAEQFKDIDTLASGLGVTVTRRYNDNNTPATDPFIVRGEFEQMLKDLEAGVIRGILFYHSDRLARMDYDAARVNRLFLMNPRLIGRSFSGGVDLSTPEGRSMFVMQATMGGMEVYATKRRVSRTNRKLAEKGHAHGAPRPFGWNDDRATLHPKEAKDLRDAILAIPGGKLVGEVRKEWMAKGYAPKRNKKSKESGNEWTLQHSTVEMRLVNPRNCGYMVYVPQETRREAGALWLPDYVVYKDGEPVMGDWEAVCSPEEWAACVAEIERRKEQNKEGHPDRDTSAKYLLTGIARCGECSFPLHANFYNKGTSSYEKYRYRYACLSNLGGCGGVTRVGPPIEDLVETAFLDEVRESLGAVVKREDVDETKNDARIAEIDEEISDANQRRKNKRISAGAAMDIIEDLENERATLIKERRQLVAAKVKRRSLEPNLIDDWPTYTISEKRARLRKSIRAVLVHKVGRGKRFDPAFIEIVWTKE
ncbi:recombinase family protein [Streptomyces sp. NPDC020096]